MNDMTEATDYGPRTTDFSPSPMNILLEQINRPLLVIDLIRVQIADRDQADDPSLFSHHGKMPDAPMLHDALGLFHVGVRPTAGHVARHYIADSSRGGVALIGHHAHENIALRENADEPAVLHDHERTDFVLIH